MKKPLSIPVYPSGKMTLKLVDIRQETNNIKTFLFNVEHFEHQPLRMHPGQSISIKMLIDKSQKAEEYIRTFTVAGFKNNQLELTIKAIEGGLVTNYMHSDLSINNIFEATGPFGEFSIVYYPNQPLLLIGAGSGLTPIMAMLRWLHQRKENTDVIFIQQSSTPDDVLFHNEINTIQRDMPNLTVYECASKVPSGKSWNSLRGRLNRKLLSALIPDLSLRTVLCCGPEGFTNTIQAIYKSEGGASSNFHTETFGSHQAAIEVIDNPSFISNNDANKGFSITLDNYSFFANEEQDLVTSAAEGGIRIPTSCREGSCGTCKVKLISGDVKSENKGGLSKKEEQNGFILACCSQPLSNLLLHRANK